MPSIPSTGTPRRAWRGGCDCATTAASTSPARRRAAARWNGSKNWKRAGASCRAIVMATVKLGLIVSPGIDQLAADELAAELGAALAERYPEVEWELDVLTDPLAEPPVHLTELVSAARRLLLEADWDLAVAITELPLRLAHRTLLSHASRTHGVALVSLPALGVVKRRRRLYDVVAETVGRLVGDRERGGAAGVSGARLGVERRLTELAGDVDDDDEDGGAVFVARVISGNLRLL